MLREGRRATSGCAYLLPMRVGVSLLAFEVGHRGLKLIGLLLESVEHRIEASIGHASLLLVVVLVIMRTAILAR